MLVSIALAPCVLRPPVAHPPSVIRPLSAVLHAVTQNGILVCTAFPQCRADLVHAASTASGSGSQRLSVIATELAKDVERYSIRALEPPQDAAGSADPYAVLLAAARWCRCDAVVVSDERERAVCLAAGYPLERLVLLEDFADSAVNLQRARWLATQRLDTMSQAAALDVVGGAIRYSSDIVIADKMIGVSIKAKGNQRDTPHHRVERLARHLSGLSFFVKAWNERSPLAESRKLSVEVITVAGGSGARGGFIDPTQLRTAFEAARQRLGLDRSAGRMTLTLKQDGDPQVFNDRLLECKGRVWGLHHGLDDFGILMGSGRRRPTMIDPASEARASVSRDIRSLSSHEPTSPETQQPS